jgi:hypothetical protein
MNNDMPEQRPAGATVALIAAWIGVGVPMLWGVFITVKKAAVLFK